MTNLGKMSSPQTCIDVRQSDWTQRVIWTARHRRNAWIMLKTSFMCAVKMYTLNSTIIIDSLVSMKDLQNSEVPFLIFLSLFKQMLDEGDQPEALHPVEVVSSSDSSWRCPRWPSASSPSRRSWSSPRPGKPCPNRVIVKRCKNVNSWRQMIEPLFCKCNMIIS